MDHENNTRKFSVNINKPGPDYNTSFNIFIKVEIVEKIPTFVCSGKKEPKRLNLHSDITPIELI